MQHPSLAEWWHFPWWLLSESFFYLLFGGLLTGIIEVLLWSGAGVLRLIGLHRAWIWARGPSLAIVLAWLCGLPANLVFIAAFRYHWYVPGDPLVDWVPFFPSGGWVIDEAFGGRFINGGSPRLLAWSWAVLAVPVWWAAIKLKNRLVIREAASRGNAA